MERRPLALDLMEKALILIASTPASEATYAFILLASPELCANFAKSNRLTSTDIVSAVVGSNVGLLDGPLVGVIVGPGVVGSGVGLGDIVGCAEGAIDGCEDAVGPDVGLKEG